jgi:hypothetical protein
MVGRWRSLVWSLSETGARAEVPKQWQLSPPHCFKVITKEVFVCPASSTSLTDKSRYIHQRSKTFTQDTTNHLIQQVSCQKTSLCYKKRQRNRSVIFALAILYLFFGKNQSTSCSRNYRNQIDLWWLRISMSYHWFPNLRALDAPRRFLKEAHQRCWVNIL